MTGKLKRIGVYFIFIVAAVAVMGIAYLSGKYPAGSETYSFIYQGSVVADAIRDGEMFPRYDSNALNGTEIFRFQAPFTIYIEAFLELMMGGDAFWGFLLFIGLTFWIGAISWYEIGNRVGRTGLGFLFGICWFFLPYNLYLLFGEGSPTKAFCVALLPAYIGLTHGFFKAGNPFRLFALTMLYAILWLSNPDYTAILTLGLFVFAVAALVAKVPIRRVVLWIASLACGILLTGVWSVPAIATGVPAKYMGAEIKNYYESMFISLNPVARITGGSQETLYLMLSLFLVAVLGVFLSYKKSKVFFWTAIILMVATSKGMYVVMSLLPAVHYFEAARYVPVAMAMVFLGFLQWDSLKKKFVYIACAVIILDILPSLGLWCGNLSMAPYKWRIYDAQERAMLEEAKEITNQRIAVFDGETLGAFPNFYFGGYGDKRVQYSLGTGIRRSGIYPKATLLYEALEEGAYHYFFDRCLDLGDDTVLIRKELLYYGRELTADLEETAALLGYEKIAENEEFILFHIDTYPKFGTVTEYYGLGIGASAPHISMSFPNIKEASSDNLNDYTYEDLKDYHVIYLAGFQYRDRKQAEDLIVRLSENGVRIVILADGIPEESEKSQSFLGINCQGITFTNGFPILQTVQYGRVSCNLFPSDYLEWRTVYINGLDKSYGWIADMDEERNFYGTVRNDNIIVLGFNLVYHYTLTKDYSVGILLRDVLGMEEVMLPEKQLVPISISYYPDRIFVKTDYDNVVTGLASVSSFHYNKGIREEGSIIVADAGDHMIDIEYPYLYLGIGISGVGLLCMIVMLLLAKRAHLQDE